MSEWSESIFGPLNFFIFGYVKGRVLSNSKIGMKNCTTTFLSVLNFGQVGSRQKNFQNHTAKMIFSKIVSKEICCAHFYIYVIVTPNLPFNISEIDKK